MKSAQITLVVLLIAAGIAAAFRGPVGCQDACDRWLVPTDLGLGVTDDLHAIVPRGSTVLDGFYAVGAGGVAVEYRDGARVERPVDARLRGVVVGRDLLVAVGDGGTLTSPTTPSSTAGSRSSWCAPVRRPPTRRRRAGPGCCARPGGIVDYRADARPLPHPGADAFTLRSRNLVLTSSSSDCGMTKQPL